MAFLEFRFMKEVLQIRLFNERTEDPVVFHIGGGGGGGGDCLYNIMITICCKPPEKLLQTN